MIFINNCFLFFWSIFALLHPDPDQDWETGSGYVSRDPIVSGSIVDPYTDPDPNIAAGYSDGGKAKPASKGN